MSTHTGFVRPACAKSGRIFHFMCINDSNGGRCTRFSAGRGNSGMSYASGGNGSCSLALIDTSSRCCAVGCGNARCRNVLSGCVAIGHRCPRFCVIGYSHRNRSSRLRSPIVDHLNRVCLGHTRTCTGLNRCSGTLASLGAVHGHSVMGNNCPTNGLGTSGTFRLVSGRHRLRLTCRTRHDCSIFHGNRSLAHSCPNPRGRRRRIGTSSCHMACCVPRGTVGTCPNALARGPASGDNIVLGWPARKVARGVYFGWGGVGGVCEGVCINGTLTITMDLPVITGTAGRAPSTSATVATRTTRTSNIRVLEVGPAAMRLYFTGRHEITISFCNRGVFEVFRSRGNNIVESPRTGPRTRVLISGPHAGINDLRVARRNSRVALTDDGTGIVFGGAAKLFEVVGTRGNGAITARDTPSAFAPRGIALALRRRPSRCCFNNNIRGKHFSRGKRGVRVIGAGG